MSLAEACYVATSAFPKAEMFGLTSQIRRSAASIPANIAEGYGLDGTPSFIRHLRIAQGSLKEVETHLLLSVRVGLLESGVNEPLLDQSERIGKMLRALIRSLLRRKEGN